MRKIFVQSRLAGLYARGSSDTGIVIAPCFTCSKDVPLYRTLGERLAKEGISVISFDYGGTWESKGQIFDFTLESSLADVASCMEYLKEHGCRRVLVGGHSYGGYVALHYTARNAVDGAISISSSEANQVIRDHLKERVHAIEAHGSVEVQGYRRKFRITKNLLQSIMASDLSAVAQNVKCPVLIMHGSEDHLLPVEESKKLARLFPSNSKLEIITGGSHMFGNPKAREILAGAMLAWIRSTIAPRDEE